MARPKTLKESERKSSRVSLLLTPALLADVTTLAQIKKISLNDFFISLAAQVVKSNRLAIDEVQAVMNKVAPEVELVVEDNAE